MEQEVSNWSADVREGSPCPVCGSQGTVFWTLRSVPVHSNVLQPSREAARAVPRASLELEHCEGCGLVWNSAFDPAQVDYRAGYEETQGHSPTFRRWLSETLDAWAADPPGPLDRVLEVGCGKGEFLEGLVERTGCEAVGIDPSGTAGRFELEGPQRPRLLRVPVEEVETPLQASLVVCRHTLEHVADPVAFLRETQRVAGGPAPIYLEVPDLTRIVREGAFWDVYYEHPLYFTPHSLQRTVLAAGGQLGPSGPVFGDQCSMQVMQSEGATVPTIAPLPRAEVLAFAARARQHLEALESRLRRSQGPVVLWGAGSKATGLLQTLGLEDRIAGVVDINPDKQGSRISGSGEPILAPAELVDLQPEVVVVMNPIYADEIREDLVQRGLEPEVLALGAVPPQG